MFFLAETTQRTWSGPNFAGIFSCRVLLDPPLAGIVSSPLKTNLAITAGVDMNLKAQASVRFQNSLDVSHASGEPGCEVVYNEHVSKNWGIHVVCVDLLEIK